MSDKDVYYMLPDEEVLSQVSILSEVQDYNHKLMNIPEIWKTTRGRGVKIAILDTGLPKHIDLHPSGSTSFINNYHEDKCGHSTHCGGIIAAIPNNGIGISGIAPDAEDYYGAVLDANGSGSVESIIFGIMWAVDLVKADIISMSIGISYGAKFYKNLEAACNYAVSKGVTVVAAAGNEYSKVGQPAMYDSVISVGAINSAKQHAEFSNKGPEVDFVAGGVDVFSTYLGNTYRRMSGTSMATPAISAVAALIIASHKDRGETLTPLQVKEHLKDIAYDVGPEGYDETFGHGIPIFGKHPAPKKKGILDYTIIEGFKKLFWWRK